jgi:hypothetical protein
MKVPVTKVRICAADGEKSYESCRPVNYEVAPWIADQWLFRPDEAAKIRGVKVVGGYLLIDGDVVIFFTSI